MKAIALISGGKDSWYACYKAIQNGLNVDCIITFIPKREDSYMLHDINTKFVTMQAEISSLEHYIFRVSGEKEREVEEMKEIIKKLQNEKGIKVIVSGAIRSNYQKQRIDSIAREIGIESYTPLWHKDEKKLLHEIVNNGFEFVVVRTAAEGIERWFGRIINKRNIENFISDLTKAKSNYVGEGGEYETFVVDMPLFSHKLKIEEANKQKDGLAFNYIIKKMGKISK